VLLTAMLRLPLHLPLPAIGGNNQQLAIVTVAKARERIAAAAVINEVKFRRGLRPNSVFGFYWPFSGRGRTLVTMCVSVCSELTTFCSFLVQSRYTKMTDLGLNSSSSGLV